MSPESSYETAATVAAVSDVMLNAPEARADSASGGWSNSMVTVERSPVADNAFGATSVLLVTDSEKPDIASSSDVRSGEVVGGVYVSVYSTPSLSGRSSVSTTVNGLTVTLLTAG